MGFIESVTEKINKQIQTRLVKETVQLIIETDIYIYIYILYIKNINIQYLTEVSTPLTFL